MKYEIVSSSADALKETIWMQGLCGITFIFILCGENLLHGCLVRPGEVRKTLPIDIVPSLVLSVHYFKGLADVKEIMGDEGKSIS